MSTGNHGEQDIDIRDEQLRYLRGQAALAQERADRHRETVQELLERAQLAQESVDVDEERARQWLLIAGAVDNGLVGDLDAPSATLDTTPAVTP